MCVAQGVALSVIGDHVGHSATSMTESYAHLYDEVRDRTADALDALWTGDAPAPPRFRTVE